MLANLYFQILAMLLRIVSFSLVFYEMKMLELPVNEGKKFVFLTIDHTVGKMFLVNEMEGMFFF